MPGSKTNAIKREEVLAALRATGPGWQTRVNDAMREWVKTHSA